MSPSHELYLNIGRSFENALESQFFGKPCFKVNGKAFISFFEEEMVFKLHSDAHTEAISLSGAKLFDPSGKKRPMKEWVQVPFTHADMWPDFAEAALKYVSAS